MILLLGGTGYIGEAFVNELKRRRMEFVPVSRKEIDYTRFELLLSLLRKVKPQFLINAAGYTGKPNVDACESARADTLAGNTLFPAMLAHACLIADIPWGHVSSGCIYSGAKLSEGGNARIEKDLSQPEIRAVIQNSPKSLSGFVEEDEPNFTFRQPPCSFYSGTKALAEEAIARVGRVFIWRLRIPFDENDNARNYLTKIQRYAKVYDNANSLSHRGDFARSCLDLWSLQAPFGIYNVTNPGWVTTRQVAQMISRILKLPRSFDFWESDEEFYRQAAKAPRSNCILDVSKLLKAGVALRPVEEALEASLEKWQPEI